MPNRSLKRGLKQALLKSPSFVRDSFVVRGAFRARERVSSLREDSADATAPDGFPVPPARLRVAVSGIADPADHLDAGVQSASALEAILERNGLTIGDLDSILDFGCGSGRVTRRWAGLSGTDVHGCDYNAEAIAWCKANLPFATWAENRLEPPLPYADDRFGLVYVLSVFTHFPEELQGPWMAEMQRVVSPGGHLIFTTMGESFRDHLSEDEQRRFDQGELIVHFPRSAGMNMCAVYHPKSRVEGLARGAGLEIVDWVAGGADAPYPQDMWLARKPA